MKLENLTMKKVQKLANEAASTYAEVYSKYILEDMIRMGVVRKTSISHYELSFSVKNVDFNSNKKYERRDGLVAYGAHGTFSLKSVCGAVSFVLLWVEFENRFSIARIVFDTNPFAETDKKIILMY